MSQVATIRALSGSMRSRIGPCHVSTMKLQTSVTAVASRAHQRILNNPATRVRFKSTTAPPSRQQSTAFATRVRFKSTTAPPSRQQSTAFASQHQQQVAHQHVTARASIFKQARDSLHSFLLKPRTVPVPRWVSPQHYTITLSEICGHASFVLVAVSYGADDFLQLRLIAVAGSTAMLFFTYFHPHGRILWLPFKWNLLFIAINSYRIGNVYLHRMHAEKLPQELRQIHSDHFYVLDPVDFYKLVQLGRMETFKQGDLVVAQVCDNMSSGGLDCVG